MRQGGKREGAGRKKKEGIARKINLRLSSEEWKHLEATNQATVSDAIHLLIFGTEIKEDTKDQSHDIRNQNQKNKQLSEHISQLENKIQQLEKEKADLLKKGTEIKKDDNPSEHQEREKGKEEYWYELIGRGIRTDDIDLGKGTIRSACKQRRFDKQTTDQILDYLFKQKVGKSLPFPLMNQGRSIRIYGLDRYALLIEKNRVYYHDKEDVALGLIDWMIQEKLHFSPEHRKESKKLEQMIKKLPLRPEFDDQNQD